MEWSCAVHFKSFIVLLRSIALVFMKTIQRIFFMIPSHQSVSRNFAYNRRRRNRDNPRVCFFLHFVRHWEKARRILFIRYIIHNYIQGRVTQLLYGSLHCNNGCVLYVVRVNCRRADERCGKINNSLFFPRNKLLKTLRAALRGQRL